MFAFASIKIRRNSSNIAQIFLLESSSTTITGQVTTRVYFLVWFPPSTAAIDDPCQGQCPYNAGENLIYINNIYFEPDAETVKFRKRWYITV